MQVYFLNELLPTYIILLDRTIKAALLFNKDSITKLLMSDPPG